MQQRKKGRKKPDQSLNARDKTAKAPGGRSRQTTIISLQRLLIGLHREADQTLRLRELILHREQVLLDFVAHQELILSLLYEDKAPPAAHAAAGLKAQVLGQAALRESRGESVQQQATRPFSLDAASGSTLVSSPAPAMNMLQHLQATAASRLSIQPPSNGSYVGALLQRATQEQVQRALQMTAADWSAFFQQSFAKLVVLLELCRRNDYTSGTSQPPSTATSAEAGAGSLFGQPSANSVTATVAAATAAIPSLTPGCNWQQVSWIVDEWVTLTAAALLLNPIPIYMATTINHGTQQQDAPPAGYWQSVVQRLKLTGWQVLHFHLALQELARLDKMTLAHNKSLAADAGCLSTLVQAAHAELHTDDDGDTAAAATGSTDIEPAAAAAAAAGTQHAALVGDGQEAQQGDSAVQQQQQQHGQACEVPSAAAKDSSTPDPNISSDSQSKQQQQEEQREGGAQQDPGTGLHVKAEDMLQRKVQKLPLQGQLMMAFNCNTLTKMQLAQVLVYSYPFLPMTMQVAAAAAQLYDDELLSLEDLDIPVEQGRALLAQAAAAKAAAAMVTADDNDDDDDDEDGHSAKVEAAAAAALPPAVFQPSDPSLLQHTSQWRRQQQQQILSRKRLLQRQQQLWWWAQQDDHQQL